MLRFSWMMAYICSLTNILTKNHVQGYILVISNRYALILTIKKTESVCPHKKNYNPSSGHQPQQTTYKVKKAKEDEPRRSRNII